MSIIDRLIPWRPGRVQRAWLVAETHAARDAVVAALKETQQTLEDRLKDRVSFEATSATLAQSRDEVMAEVRALRGEVAAQAGVSAERMSAGLAQSRDEVRALRAEMAAQAGVSAETVSASAAQSRDAVIGELRALRAEVAAQAGVSAETMLASSAQSRDDIIAQVRAVRADIGAQISFATHDMVVQLQDLRSALLEVGTATASRWEDTATVQSGRLQAIKEWMERISVGDSRREEAAKDQSARLQAIEAWMPQIGAEGLHLEKAATYDHELHAIKQWLERISVETSNMLVHLDTSIQSRLNQIESIAIEARGQSVDIAGHITHTDTSVHSRLNQVETAALAAMQRISVETSNMLIHLDTSIQSRLNQIESIALEVRGQSVDVASQVTHIDTSLHSRLNQIETVALAARDQATHVVGQAAHIDTSLHSRLNALENVLIPSLAQQVHEIGGAQLRRAAESSDRSRWRVQPGELYAPARSETFETILARAESDFPDVYRAWRQRLDAMREAFSETKVGNAARGGDLYSRMFRSFVEIHVSGRVLDVGCGPFGRPYYLSSYPADLISGLEPLRQREAADFELVQGVSEYLPWPDGSFSTVLSATALDHCLSLDRSLASMRRVLSPEGLILLWIGSVPGATPFRPDHPGFEPADRFHLFHFDVAWFEPMLEDEFDVVDRLELQQVGYSHVFYALRPKLAADAPA